MRVTESSFADPGILSRLRAFPALPSLVLAALGLAACFWLDYSTDQAPFQHLYYIPLVFAALRFGIRGGTAASIAAIFLYHLANGILTARAIRASSWRGHRARQVGARRALWGAVRTRAAL